MYENMSILDWCQAMLNLKNNESELTKKKFTEIRKQYDAKLITEEEFIQVVEEMNLAGGYDALGD